MASAAVDGALELTEENVEVVLDEVRAVSAVAPLRRVDVCCAFKLSWPAVAG